MATAGNYDPALRGVVRTYSNKVARENPDDPLCKALGEVAKAQELSAAKMQVQVKEKPKSEISWETWIKFEETESEDAQVAYLQNRCREVSQVWEEFHVHFKLEGNEHLKRTPPTIQTLEKAVAEAENRWLKKKESGFGKVKSRCQGFLSTMQDYSFLFEFIPAEDKYIKLITGTITSIVRISDNHVKIAERFSSSLEEISDDLKSVKKSTAVSDTPAMRRHVVDLYVRVFSFFCTAMKWFQNPGHRFMSAINRNYEKTLEETVSGIRDVLGRIRLQAVQATEERVQATEKKVQDMYCELKALTAALTAAGDRRRGDDVDIMAKLEEISEDIALHRLGYRAELALCAHGERFFYDQQVAQAGFGFGSERLPSAEQRKLIRHVEEETPADHYSTIDPPTQGQAPLTAPPCKLKRADMQLLAAKISEYLKYGDVYDIVRKSTSDDGALPQAVALRLSDWVKQTETKFLRVEGPVEVESEERIKIAVARIAVALQHLKLACVSFFARSQYDHGPAAKKKSKQKPRPRGEESMTAMLYSLVAQLVLVLPAELDLPAEGAEDDLLAKAQEAFDALDGTAASLPKALDLIEALLEHSPPTMIFVLDKINLAEGHTTRKHLKRLMAILRARGKTPGNAVRVLLTTSGACLPLTECLKKSEQVTAEGMERALAGRPLTGFAAVE